MSDKENVNKGLFSSTHQPNSGKRGRPVGSKGKRTTLPSELTSIAIEKLEAACIEGEQWAVIEVLKRVAPTLKPVTPENSIDAEVLQIKIDEATSFCERLEALEARFKAVKAVS